MHTSNSHKKHLLRSVNNRLLFWEITLSLTISTIVSIGVCASYFFGFKEGTTQVLLALFMVFVGLGSFIITWIALIVWDHMSLRSASKKRLKIKPLPHRHNSRVTIPTLVKTTDEEITDTYFPGKEHGQHITTVNYQSFVNEFIENQLKFQATSMEESVSQNSEHLNVDFIKQRLMEKETRIVEVVDMHVAKNPNHMYDFSATIYITAKSLKKAAEVVDSANSILEDEFNIKDTRLLPIITR